jgi:hypothetical protein
VVEFNGIRATSHNPRSVTQNSPFVRRPIPGLRGWDGDFSGCLRLLY